MKKLFAVFMIIIILTGCSTHRQETEKPQADRQLLNLLEKGADAARDKTASAYLKRITATKDILLWIDENKPEYEVVRETVRQFIADYEYDSESMQILENITDLLEQLENEKAGELLDMIGISRENFTAIEELCKNFEKAIEEVREQIVT